MIKAYKGYTGSIEFSVDDKCFYGQLSGIRDTIIYESEQIMDLQKEFEQSVDTYLCWCKDRNKEPQKPKSGKLAVRLAPEIHEMVASAASNDAKSINQWIADALKDAAEKRLADASVKIKIR